MITEWPFIYVYGCARDDGFNYAIGMKPADGPVNGAVALFAELTHAQLFAGALHAQMGGTLSSLPTSES